MLNYIIRFNLIFTVKLGDLQSASESFERSLDIAKKLNDGPAEAAIKKAMEEVNNRIVQGVKEGDGKDDEDRESVKSDKDRKGATSQASGNQFFNFFSLNFARQLFRIF